MLNVVGKLAVLVDSSKIGERAGCYSASRTNRRGDHRQQADAAILKQLEDQGVSVIRV